MGNSETLLKRCREIASSTWADALDKFAIPGVVEGLPQRAGSGRIAGFAVTVRESTGPLGSFALSDFSVGRIIEAGRPDHVLMIDTGGESISTFGGLASRASKTTGVEGVIIDGACRDVEEIEALGLWLASRHVTPLTGKKRIKVESIGEPITMGGIPVAQGDLVIADETGIVVVPQAHIAEVFAEAERIHTLDLQIESQIKTGNTFSAATKAAGHM